MTININLIVQYLFAFLLFAGSAVTLHALAEKHIESNERIEMAKIHLLDKHYSNFDQKSKDLERKHDAAVRQARRLRAHRGN